MRRLVGIPWDDPNPGDLNDRANWRVVRDDSAGGQPTIEDLAGRWCAVEPLSDVESSGYAQPGAARPTHALVQRHVDGLVPSAVRLHVTLGATTRVFEAELVAWRRLDRYGEWQRCVIRELGPGSTAS